MRVAIYARYSSENQNERSIDDQLRLCRDHAAAMAGQVVATYADYAMSGSHLRSRPEAIRLLADAKADLFDVVLAESLDRLSRDQEDVAGIFKRLTFAGLRLVTVSEGDISELHVGLKGTMNALYIKDLASKVRRGLTGRALAGFSAGGLSYGYDVERSLDARGELERGKRVVNEDQAAVVRRIFGEYAGGRSTRAIASALNRDGIPSPTGGTWNCSSIAGNRARGSGILYNEAYAGILVFGRTTFVKDPESGRRISRAVHSSKWIRTPVPHLRIVSDDLWQAAQVAKGDYSGGRPEHHRRPKHLLSGLLFCGSCGAAYTIRREDQLGCSAHRQKGTCDNARSLRLAEIEDRMLGGIAARLVAPAAIAAFLIEYQAERKRLAADGRRQKEADLARLATARHQIRRAVDAIVDGRASQAIKDRLFELEAEAAQLETALAAAGPIEKVVELHPAAIDSYRRAVGDLRELLAGSPEMRDEAKAVIRTLVERIDITPLAAPGKTSIQVHGRIAELLNLPNRPPGMSLSAVSMVAGARYTRCSPTIMIRC